MSYAELFMSTVILLSVYFVLKIRNRKRNLPTGPIGLPVVGYLPFLTKTPHLKFIELAKKYGNIFSMYLGSKLVVVLNDGDSIREVLSKKELLARPPNSPFAFFGIQTPFFSPDFKLWQEQRRFVVHSMKDLGFGKSKLEEHIQDEIQHFLGVLEKSNKRRMDFIKPLTPSVSNNICSLVFGERYDYDDPDRLIMDNTLRDVTSRLAQTSVIIYFPWIKYLPFLVRLLDYQKARKAAANIFRLIGRKVDEHKKTLDSKNVRDFIDRYLLEIEARKATDSEPTFTETNLKGITLNLFGAGSETVRTCVSWCMYIMAAYRFFQLKVHREIHDVLGSDKVPQFADHKNMPYCQAVIREVLRWKTIAPINPLRYALDDIEINGLCIPKGAMVLANLWAVHHDPKHWADPDKFNPSRFLNEDGTILKTNHFMPFSVGKRSCPGESMAMMEVFLYFVSILQKFYVHFSSGYRPTFEGELGISYRPKEFEIHFMPKSLLVGRDALFPV